MWDPKDIVFEVFGKEGLKGISRNAVESLEIPTKSKDFLLHVGLPKENILLCNFELDSELFPTITDHAQRIGIIMGKSLPYKVIGTDGYMQICLSEKDASGEVIAYDIRNDIPQRFINESIENFVGFLALYAEACDKFAGLQDAEMKSKATEFRITLSKLEPRALESDKTWWFLITQQLEEGML